MLHFGRLKPACLVILEALLGIGCNAGVSWLACSKYQSQKKILYRQGRYAWWQSQWVTTYSASKLGQNIKFDFSDKLSAWLGRQLAGVVQEQVQCTEYHRICRRKVLPVSSSLYPCAAPYIKCISGDKKILQEKASHAAPCVFEDRCAKCVFSLFPHISKSQLQSKEPLNWRMTSILVLEDDSDAPAVGKLVCGKNNMSFESIWASLQMKKALQRIRSMCREISHLHFVDKAGHAWNLRTTLLSTLALLACAQRLLPKS